MSCLQGVGKFWFSLGGERGFSLLEFVMVNTVLILVVDVGDVVHCIKIY